MSQLKLGLRLAIINNFATYPLTFFGAPAGGILEPKVASGADAVIVKSPGIGDLRLEHLGPGSSIRITRSQPASKHRISITAADAAQVKLKADLPDTFVNFQLIIESVDARSEFAAHNTREQRRIPISVELFQGDTEVELLSRINRVLNTAIDLFPEVDGQGEYWLSKFEGGKLTIDAKDVNLRLKLKVDDIDIDNARQLTAFAPVTESEQSQGVGTFEMLRQIIMPTPGSHEVWGLNDGKYLPVEGTAYTCIDIKTITPRPDLHGGAGAASESISQAPEYRIYVAEGAVNDDAFDNFLKFLNKATGSKTYVRSDGSAGTAAGMTFVVDASDPA